MATKNLAHTVVEGGRSGYSKLDCKLRNRNERRMRFDSEDDVVCGKVRRAGFADHLGPLERWLGRHVGRGWSNIYRESPPVHQGGRYRPLAAAISDGREPAGRKFPPVIARHLGGHRRE